MLIQLLLTLWAFAALVWDWRSRRLPNALTLGGLGAGLAWLAALPATPLGAGRADALVALVLAFLILLPGYLRGQLGAGDVKLGAAMGTLGGLLVLAQTLLVAGLVAGLLALGRLVGEGLARGRWPLLQFALLRIGLHPATTTRFSGIRVLPFGSAMAVGFIGAVWGLGWVPA